MNAPDDESVEEWGAPAGFDCVEGTGTISDRKPEVRIRYLRRKITHLDSRMEERTNWHACSRPRWCNCKAHELLQRDERDTDAPVATQHDITGRQALRIMRQGIVVKDMLEERTSRGKEEQPLAKIGLAAYNLLAPHDKWKHRTNPDEASPCNSAGTSMFACRLPVLSCLFDFASSCFSYSQPVVGCTPSLLSLDIRVLFDFFLLPSIFCFLVIRMFCFFRVFKCLYSDLGLLL